LAGFWGDGMIHVLRAFANRGAPSRRVRDWGGRWWTTWGALDFLPMGNIVMVANPHAFNPLMEASEIEISGRDKGRIVVAAGYQSYGESVRRSRSKSCATTEIWLSAIRLRPESKVATEMKRRFGAANRAAKRRNALAPR
jgi:hypothetical protein